MIAVTLEVTIALNLRFNDLSMELHVLSLYGSHKEKKNCRWLCITVFRDHQRAKEWTALHSCFRSISFILSASLLAINNVCDDVIHLSIQTSVCKEHHTRYHTMQCISYTPLEIPEQSWSKMLVNVTTHCLSYDCSVMCSYVHLNEWWGILFSWLDSTSNLFLQCSEFGRKCTIHLSVLSRILPTSGQYFVLRIMLSHPLCTLHHHYLNVKQSLWRLNTRDLCDAIVITYQKMHLPSNLVNANGYGRMCSWRIDFLYLSCSLCWDLVQMSPICWFIRFSEKKRKTKTMECTINISITSQQEQNMIIKSWRP